MSQPCVHEVFSQKAQLYPEKTAVSTSHGPKNYRELEEESNRCAHFLLKKGVRREDLVLVFGASSEEMVIALLAIFKAGACFVPWDCTVPLAKTKEMISRFSPRFLLVNSDSVIREQDASALGIENVFSLPQALAEETQADFPAVSWSSDGTCYLYFTSGSTGEPKAIAGRMSALNNFIAWEQSSFALKEGEKVSQLTHPTFDAYLRDVFFPLCNGGTISIPKTPELVGESKRFLGWLEKEEISFLHCVPSLFRILLQANLTSHSLLNLRYVLTSGEALFPQDTKTWYELFGERISLVNLYGPSEATMIKFSHPVRSVDTKARSIPIGKPLPGTEAFLLDSHGQACSPGKVGEIYLKTLDLSKGYYQNEEASKRVFLCDPREKNSSFSSTLVYKTGDYGRILLDGNWEFLGRQDRQVKIRGVRIELEAIEKSLQEIKGVEEVAVAEQKDKQGNKYLGAYLVISEKQTLESIRKIINEKLPESMHPSAFAFLPSLPRTLSGKIDYKSLPALGQSREHLTSPFVPPQTESEKSLLSIWEELLALSPIGIEDSFLDLGGHSLLATQVLSRIFQHFSVEIPLGVFLEKNTISELALEITHRQLNQTEEAEALLAEIESLSEEELDRLLEEEV